MNKDLAQGPLGQVGKYDVKFDSGFLVVSASANIPPGESFDASLSVDSDKVLDAIAAAIPGKVDDAVIALIKLALKQ